MQEPKTNGKTFENMNIGAMLDEFKNLQSRHQPQPDRVSIQPKLVGRFYDIITRFYVIGWGAHFHFAPRDRNESVLDSLRRFHEEIVKHLELDGDMIVGDLGCGIGGPMSDIAKISGTRVVGMNVSEDQIERGRAFIKEKDLDGRCEFVNASFQNLPQGDDFFDAIYSIEAMLHSPDKPQAFGEAFRTLKPGGKIVIVDWLLTDIYDDDNERHKDVRNRIEYTSASSRLYTPREQTECIEKAGFEILYAADYALNSDPETSWYASLESNDISLSSLARIPLGRAVIPFLTRVLEWLRLAPAGTSEASKMLNLNADTLVESGKLGIFTPSFLILARKPGTS